MTEFFGEEIQVVSVGMPVGVMIDYGGDTAPSDWMLCQGQALLRADYAALFAVLGTKYGDGDGSGAEFNLPDTRFRVTVGSDATRALGAAGGVEKHALSLAEAPVHSHGGATGIDAPNHSHHIDLYTQDPNWYTGAPQLIVGTGAAGSSYGANYFPGNTQTGLLGLLSGTQHNHRVLGDVGGVNANHAHAIPVDGGGQQHENMPPFVVVHKIIKVI
jgi:microcystin-dependent protein